MDNRQTPLASLYLRSPITSKNVTQNLGIKPTEQQPLQWESENADRIAEGKRVRKTWKPTQQLGKFHEVYVALHTIEVAFHEVYVELKQKIYIMIGDRSSI